MIWNTVLCKSNANEIRRSSFFVLANFRAMSSEKFHLQTIFPVIFRRNIARYFERSNEKSLLRKFAEAKIRTATTLYTKPERYLSVAVIQSQTVLARMADSCLIRLENVF